MTDRIITVDEFILRIIQPEYQEIAQTLRSLMRKYATDAEECTAYGIPHRE